ncbi:hypothetical protein AcW1_001725 [Taiwanofungus camphoratus]|nr:hypothetical protein AcW1_001725 [Antrodia cinnamomea]
MKNARSHEHSDAAYDILDQCIIGRLGSAVSDEVEVSEKSSATARVDKNMFLDLSKPLMSQLWNAKFNKAFYMEEVHKPRHTAERARFFASNFLEIFSLTPWYVVPLVWFPVMGYFAIRSALQFTLGDNALPPLITRPLLPITLFKSVETPLVSFEKVGLCIVFAMVAWTMLEYILHRFLFHIDALLPDHPAALTAHFLIHGCHHYLPMDRLRLPIPPAMFAIIAFPVIQLAYAIFAPATANGVIAGTVFSYILYDMIHYALHYEKFPWRELKTYHLTHHYKNPDSGYGVTSMIWDYVFNTVLPM